ncbi:MAG: hypothetical protein Q7J47_15345 [Azoarcus sp.]|nr:hypothetical protein [Azoarcus sp.]
MRFIFAVVIVASVAVAGCAGQAAKGQVGSGNAISIASPAKDRTFRVQKITPTNKAVGRDAIIASIQSSLREDMLQDATLVYNGQVGAFEAKWKWALALNYNVIAVSFPLVIEESDTEYKVTLQCPKTMWSDIQDFSITGIPKWNNEKIGTSVSNACASTAVLVPYTEEFKGEINTAFNDVSVFSNYKRKLSPVPATVWHAYRDELKVTSLDIEKSQQFLVPSPRGNVIASVVVFPYRNGSKVVYAFGYRYFVKGDGTTTYSQAEVDGIKKMMADTAND